MTMSVAVLGMLSCYNASTEKKKLNLFFEIPKTNYICNPKSENSSVGRARPCQGRGRGFESRFSLKKISLDVLPPFRLLNNEKGKAQHPPTPTHCSPRWRNW